jgi:fimbrial chaperone protein
MSQYQLRKFGRIAARLAASVLAMTALALAAPAEAMRVSPMVAEISLTGGGSSARIDVGNETDTPLPYETHITRVDFDADGTLHETPADDDFLVFPPQGVIGAKGHQTIRVQWVGDPLMKASRSYYLEVRQLPIPFAETGSSDKPSVSIQILYRIKAMITVAPKGAKSSVSVVSVEPMMIDPPHRQSVLSTDPKAAAAALAAQPAPPKIPGLRVTVTNTGTRHALMGGVNWIVDGTAPDGKPFHVAIPRETVGAAIGIGYLSPEGGQRIFNLPFDQPTKGPVTIRFTE